MRNPLPTLLTLTVLAAAGCSGPAAKKGHDVIIVQPNPADLALWRDADLVVCFYTWQWLCAEKPEIMDGAACANLTKETFLSRWGALTTDRKLALVIFPKTDAPPEKELDEVESFFKGLGFQRVVLKLGRNTVSLSGEADPLLRDSSRARSP
jgi:hypothetical protein